jgi:hypothetical protein
MYTEETLAIEIQWLGHSEQIHTTKATNRFP